MAAKVISATRARRSPLLAVAMVMAVAAWSAIAGHTFSMQAGMSRKQAKSNLHTRGNLPKQVLEIPLEQPEPEEETPEPLPEQRTPYTMHMVMHMVSQLPHAKHLSEESSLTKFIQDKITGALSNAEDLIKHVEVRVQVLEHFHREKVGHKKVVQPAVNEVQTDGDKFVEAPADSRDAQGGKMLAPYQVKVIVSLKNHHEIIFSNPEKHAQHTITEATDVAVEGLKRLLQEEKQKMIQKSRKARDQDEIDAEASFQNEAAEEEAMAAKAALEAAEEKRDAVMEDFYHRVEENMDSDQPAAGKPAGGSE